MNLDVLPPPIDPPPPLEITTPSLPDTRAGAPYAVAFAAEGGYTPYTWICEGPDVQSGLAVGADGILSGSPRAPGTIPFRISVTDAFDQTRSMSTTLRVRPARVPVKVLTSRAGQGRVGQAYEVSLSAVGGFPPYTWQHLSGVLPPGLSLDNSTGLITGVPTAANEDAAAPWRAVFAVGDAEEWPGDRDVELDFDILTAAAARPLVITTRAVPTLLAGTMTDLTLACKGGVLPYRWRASGLPSGLRLDGDRIVGEADAAGQYAVRVEVQDAAGSSGSADLLVHVKHLAPLWLLLLLAVLLGLSLLLMLWLILVVKRSSKTEPLCILTDAVPNARASAPYSVQLACKGGVAPYRWRVVEGELPPGLKLSEKGKIGGTPFEGILVDRTKDVPFTVQLRDGAGTTARQAL
jgi:hypothetical protein